jgi:hypothetical protein
MTAAQLIKFLQTVPDDAVVTIWVTSEGKRYEFNEDPFWFWQGETHVVDLNTAKEHRYKIVFGE